MPRHIRDFFTWSARKFKVNQDARRSDNRENDPKTPNSACILRVYGLTILVSYWLAYGFYRRYTNERNETFLKFLPLLKLAVKFTQSLSMAMVSPRLRTFAPIVYAHAYCARYSLSNCSKSFKNI